MPMLDAEGMKDGSSQGPTVEAGKDANVVLVAYEPFYFGANKDKKMPKYRATDADTGAELEFVGFKFHDCIKELNDSIEPGTTVLHVRALENGTKYCDYEITVVKGAKAAAVAPGKTDLESTLF